MISWQKKLGCVSTYCTYFPFSREELEGFVSSSTLSHLKVCFSRDDQEEEAEETAAPVGRARYVQHNLLRNSPQITNILLKQNGRLYVCG